MFISHRMEKKALLNFVNLGGAMSFTKHSELDKSENLSVDDFIKAFELNDRLARTIKYITRYSQHQNTKAGRKNLERAIEELRIELKFICNND